MKLIPFVVLASAATTAWSKAVNVSTDLITDALLGDVTSLHQGCLVNTDMMENYTGGALETTKVNDTNVLLTFAAMNGAQLKIIADAQLAPNLTANDTERIVDLVVQTIQQSIPATVEALEDKHSEIQKANLTSVVKNSLQMFLTSHEATGEAIDLKFDLSNHTMANALSKELKNVTESIQHGIKMFSSNSTSNHTLF